MTIQKGKQLRHVKIKDSVYTSLKHKAVDCQQSLQDYVNMVLEDFLKNNLTQVTN